MQRKHHFISPIAVIAGPILILILLGSSLAISRVSQAGTQATPTVAATIAPATPTSAAAPEVQQAIPGVDAQLFARTELYFGSERPGADVTRHQFMQFLDAEVTPRFPDGLTLLTGHGQFREGDGTLVEETSFVLILFYPYEDRAESSALIEQIRAQYIDQFDQESVLRVDDPRPVQVSF
jgi:hypothetical protein